MGYRILITSLIWLPLWFFLRVIEWLFIASSAMNDFVHKIGSQSLASTRLWPWASPSPRLGVGWTEVWALPVPLGSCASWAKFFSETEKPQFLKSFSGANTYSTGWWQRPSEIRLSVKKTKQNKIKKQGNCEALWKPFSEDRCYPLRGNG